MSTNDRRDDESSYKKSKRGEILAVAAELFAERGFAATTVRDVGDRVGMYSGSLYYYFRSKEAMADALLTRYLGHIWQQYDEIAVRADSPRERLTAVLAASIRSIDEFHDEVAIFQREGPRLAQQEGFGYVTERTDAYSELVIGLLAAGIEAGEFRPALDTALTYRYIRDSVWPIVAWYRPGGPISIDAVCEHYLDILFDGIARSG